MANAAPSIINQSYELVDVDQLTPHPENPRVGDVNQLTASIGDHGFYGAVVAQKTTGHVLAGNHRLAAAQHEGLTQLPVVWVDVDDTMARRILLVDNRAAERATWDYEQLATVLAQLVEADEDISSLGWEPHELDALLEATWNPGAAEDLENFANGPAEAGHTVSFSEDEWEAVRSATALVRQRHGLGDDDYSDAGLVAILCRHYVDRDPDQ